MRAGWSGAFSLPRVLTVLEDNSLGLEPAPELEALRGPLPLQVGQDLVVRIFVDRSIIEVYANGRFCQTIRSYPERGDSLGIGLMAQGDTARIRSIDIWELNA